jgi:phosphohistidine phosphatase SixA
VVKDAGVNAVITTQFARTRLTAQPAARAVGEEPMANAARGTIASHVQVVADSIRTRFAGKTVLVVGHSNTISAIVGALGAPRPPDPCDAEYDALFVVVLGDGGSARFLRSRYGAPSDVSSCTAMK